MRKRQSSKRPAVKMIVPLKPEVHDGLRQFAAAEDRSMRKLASRAVEEAVKGFRDRQPVLT